MNDKDKYELNTKISILRGWVPHSCVKCVARGDTHYVQGYSIEHGRIAIKDEYPDWQAADHWPVLLREMPLPIFWQNPNGQWTCQPNMELGEGDEITVTAPTLEEATCLAWLELKTYLASDDMKGKYVKHVSVEDRIENE